ncbi:hypothetical protein JRQ81_005684 [Phrynocephalus forsythii]|uniref:LsmAD domain-containing protein n=1 Tax=Phrynocephalus forsythii TaxID=171643 RepID=A0A9Q0XII2_9SAUR|nr:hypothetical protein JRQ81_005684 [Phrynocephalus forsythii]
MAPPRRKKEGPGRGRVPGSPSIELRAPCHLPSRPWVPSRRKGCDVVTKAAALDGPDEGLLEHAREGQGGPFGFVFLVAEATTPGRRRRRHVEAAAAAAAAALALASAALARLRGSSSSSSSRRRPPPPPPPTPTPPPPPPPQQQTPAAGATPASSSSSSSSANHSAGVASAHAARKTNPAPASSPNGSLSPGTTAAAATEEEEEEEEEAEPTPPGRLPAAAAAAAAAPVVVEEEAAVTLEEVAPGTCRGGRRERGSGQSTGKGPPQTPVFEGVYNNSRMLHFLTAVVGSTCDVKVKNGSTFEGIFKTLSSKPADVMLVHFRNVDFNYATKDKFTDSAIAMNSKVNGEHKEKVLQRWEGGDSNSDDYDLESDMSNGWDPNEMFKFNEENYGVKTTYDSSLSSYTVPLEKDNSEEFRQREARAAQLAREIESSPQYRLRIAMENDDGRTEEEKHSSVQRQVSGRDSPSLVSREGKYIPLPQRVREGSRGGVRCSSSRGGRAGMGSLPPRGSTHHSESNAGSIPEQRGINGGPSRMSPKSQRPNRGAKSMSSPSSRPMEVSAPSPTVGRVYTPRSPKSASAVPVCSQDPPVGSAAPAAPASPSESRPAMESSASPTPPSPKVPPSAPVAAVEVKEVPTSATKEPSRTLEVMGGQTWSNRQIKVSKTSKRGIS